MKRSIFHSLFLVFFASLPTLLQAQDYYGSTYDTRKVVMGITFSPNFNWLNYEDGEEVNKTSKLGYSYGLIADFRISQNYYFSTGFLINNLKANSDIEAPGLETSYTLQYLKVPITLKLKSTQRYYRSYYGQFGFTGGMKISGKQEMGDAPKEDLKKDADALRLGLHVGGGVEWQLDHKLSMMTGLSYNSGFTSVLKAGKPRNAYLAFDFAIFF